MAETNRPKGPPPTRAKQPIPMPGIARKSRADIRSRLEQWAMNPRCPSNEVSVVLGVPMREVAVAEGLTPTTGQSRFALAAGNRFERSLFAAEAKLLREELVKQGILPEGPLGFLDLRLTKNGGPLRSQEEAIGATRRVLQQAASGAKVTPSIVASAAIRLPGTPLLPEAVLVLDALIMQTGQSPARLLVAEVKTYPDRGGFTDTLGLAGARAQAGAYVHGLDVLVEQLDLGAALVVSRQGILILTRPGRYYPSIRAAEDLRYQAARARRGLARLQELAVDIADRAGEDPVRCILEAETVYGPSCLAFCDRARGCFRRALKKGDPAVLGEEAKAFLGAVDLARAAELLGGAKACNVGEEDLLQRLREAGRTIR
jgi:hypothetical protein